MHFNKFAVLNGYFAKLCYVVGSQRLMPPDALQPKAYCTNPGLQSFLLAPPGVSTRDPSSERRNYLGEKWPVIWTESCDFHAYTFGFFYMPQICDMGQTALLPFRRKVCWDAGVLVGYMWKCTFKYLCIFSIIHYNIYRCFNKRKAGVFFECFVTYLHLHYCRITLVL